MAGKKHCWHPTGVSSSYGTGAPIDAGVFCCFCGKRETVAWTIERQRIPGHGGYHTEHIHHYATNDGPCPSRNREGRALRRQRAKE